MERTSRPKSQHLSQKNNQLILDAARGRRFSNDSIQTNEICDMIIRLSDRYFTYDASAREILQIANQVRSEFPYLTLEECELAMKLALAEEIEMPYRPKSITIEFITKLLKNYSRVSYPLKFPKQAHVGVETPGERYSNLVNFVNFYHLFPRRTDYLVVCNWLIESRAISKPEGWDELTTHADKALAASRTVKWWLEVSFPGVINRDTHHTPYQHTRRGPIQQLVEKAAEYLRK